MNAQPRNVSAREDLVDPLGTRATQPVLERRDDGGMAAGQAGRDQIVLALEMAVHRRLGHIRFADNAIDADGVDALAIEQAASDVDDVLGDRRQNVSGHERIQS
jgi:hypothetical protein